MSFSKAGHITGLKKKGGGWTGMNSVRLPEGADSTISTAAAYHRRTG